MTSLLERLRELHEAGQPTPTHIAVMEDGSTHYTDRARVARMKGAALAWDALPAVVALIEQVEKVEGVIRTCAVERLEVDADGLGAWAILLSAALAPFVSEATPP